jgi:hypothetical protein
MKITPTLILKSLTMKYYKLLTDKALSTVRGSFKMFCEYLAKGAITPSKMTFGKMTFSIGNCE